MMVVRRPRQDGPMSLADFEDARKAVGEIAEDYDFFCNLCDAEAEAEMLDSDDDFWY